MKEKIYYFQEKSNDILDLQDDFTAEEIGIYFILKAAYFKYAGELKEENLCQRCKFFGNREKLNEVKNKVFEIKEGFLVNNSWLSQINEIKQRSEKRRLAALGKWEKEKKKKRKKEVKNDTNKEEEIIIKEEDNIPDFIDKKLLQDFFDFRESIATKKKPFTERAKELIIKHLTQFESKKAGFANLALENAIANSWQGVFEPNNSDSKILKPFSLIDELNLIAGEQLFKVIDTHYDKALLRCITIDHKEQALKLDSEIRKKIKEKIAEKYPNKALEVTY